MPGEGLEVPDELAALSQQRQAAMPEVVESDGGEARMLEQWFIVAVHDVLGVERLALTGGEDEPLIVVGRGY